MYTERTNLGRREAEYQARLDDAKREYDLDDQAPIHESHISDAYTNLGLTRLAMGLDKVPQAFSDLWRGRAGRSLGENLGTAARVFAYIASTGLNDPESIEYAEAKALDSLEKDQVKL